MTPTSGEIVIAGHAPGVETKALVSYLPERSYLSDWMRVEDALRFFCDFYADFDRRRAEDMLQRLNIALDAPIKSLSKGTKEKVQLILVMSRNARLYLLDRRRRPRGPGLYPAYHHQQLFARIQRDHLHPPDQRHRTGAGRGHLYQSGAAGHDRLGG